MTSWSLTGQKVLDPSFSWRRIPYTLRVSLAATFLIGVAAHFFCYTNVMFNHDAAAMYWERISFSTGASGSRWLAPVWQAMVACVQMPWLEGILTLLLYAVSAWLVCETLHIRYTALIVLVNGILVTSPTAISSNLYLSSAHQYAGALLFACLAVYLFERYRFGWLGAAFCLLLSSGSYASYVNFAVALFLLVQIVRIFAARRQDERKLLADHFRFLFTVAAGLAGTLGLSSWLLWRDPAAEGRVNHLVEGEGPAFLERIGEAVGLVGEYFSPWNDLSYFQENTLLYALFALTAVCTVAAAVVLLIHNRLWQQPLRLLVLAVDLVCMPLAMNLIGMFYKSHTLMQFAFVIPWLLFLMLAQTLAEQPDLRGWIAAGARRAAAFTGYALLVAALSVVTIVSGVYLANVSYMKAYALYESGIALTNRIVERIESTPGYTAAQTRVVLVGDIEKNYSPYREGFALCDDITGVGRYSWDTALTYNLVLSTYIEQELGIQMEFMNPGDSVYPDTAPEFLAENGVAWAGESQEILAGMETFPAQGCIYLRDDVLLIKLGE